MKKLLLFCLTILPILGCDLPQEIAPAYALATWATAPSQALQGSYLGLLPAELRRELLHLINFSPLQVLTKWANEIENYVPNNPDVPTQDIVLKDPALRTVGSTSLHYPHVACSPCGTIIATTTIAPTNYDIHLWNTKTGALLHTFPDHLRKATKVAFTRSGKILAKQGSFGVSLYDLATKKLIATHIGYELILDSNKCVYAIRDREYRLILNSDTGLTINSFRARHSTSNTEQTLIALVESQTITIWDRQKNTIKCTIKYPEQNTNSLLSMTFSSSNILLTIDAVHGITQWNIENGAMLKRYAIESPANNNELHLSPCGKFIISMDESIRHHPKFLVWDSSSGRLLYAFEHTISHIAATIDGIHFLHDDEFFVIFTSVEETWIIESMTGKIVKKIPSPRPLQYGLHSNAACLNCPELMATYQDQTVYFWDIKKNSYYSSLKHTSRILSLNYFPQIGCFVTTAKDGTARIWKNTKSIALDCLVKKTTPFQWYLMHYAWQAFQEHLPLNLINFPATREAFDQLPDIVKQTLRSKITIITNQQEMDAYVLQHANRKALIPRTGNQSSGGLLEQRDLGSATAPATTAPHIHPNRLPIGWLSWSAGILAAITGYRIVNHLLNSQENRDEEEEHVESE